MATTVERIGFFSNVNQIILFYVGLLTFIILILYFIWRKMNEVIPELETYTLDELSRFKKDENYDMKTYISIKGRVFDISEHDMFLPEGKYYKLAGHEVGVALAKGSLEDKYIDNLDISILTHNEKKMLTQVYLNFSNDFDLVGHLKEWVDKYGLEETIPKTEKKKRTLGLDTRKNVKLENLEKIEVKDDVKELSKDVKKEVKKEVKETKKEEVIISDGDDEKDKKESTLKKRKKKTVPK